MSGVGQPHLCERAFAQLPMVYGGCIASVVDCHCICTAVAHAYDAEGRAIGEGEAIWYRCLLPPPLHASLSAGSLGVFCFQQGLQPRFVTGNLSVNYKK
eukprot:gene2604-3306_t